MNTGQMLLTIGAMVLLSLTILRVNNDFLNTTTTLNETKFGVLAVSLATSIIEEANKKAFDTATDGDAITDMNLLTSPAALGPAIGETYDNYNDFDDFNGYSTDVTNLPSANFHLSCSVCYVNPLNPDQTSSSKTWNKKISVNVTSPSMKDTIKVSSIYSYWFFR